MSAVYRLKCWMPCVCYAVSALNACYILYKLVNWLLTTDCPEVTFVTSGMRLEKRDSFQPDGKKLELWTSDNKKWGLAKSRVNLVLIRKILPVFWSRVENVSKFLRPVYLFTCPGLSDLTPSCDAIPFFSLDFLWSFWSRFVVVSGWDLHESNRSRVSFLSFDTMMIRWCIKVKNVYRTWYMPKSRRYDYGDKKVSKCHRNILEKCGKDFYGNWNERKEEERVIRTQE